jgi:hypothetical protein
LGADYTEVHFEELVSQPRETLAKLGQFIEQDLNYDQILRVGIGSVSAPNTSFGGGTAEDFNPVGRWQSGYSAEELAMFEGLVGQTLKDTGYALAAEGREAKDRIDLRLMRAMYRTYFETKLYLKAKTPLGKLLATRDLS